MSEMTVVEWARIKRCTPAYAYWNLLSMARRKEAVMHPEMRGVWRDKWPRRVNTRFSLPQPESTP